MVKDSGVNTRANVLACTMVTLDVTNSASSKSLAPLVEPAFAVSACVVCCAYKRISQVMFLTARQADEIDVKKWFSYVYASFPAPMYRARQPKAS